MGFNFKYVTLLASVYQRPNIPLAFPSYIKGSWSNAKPIHLDKVPTVIQVSPHRYRRWIERMIDWLGGWL